MATVAGTHHLTRRVPDDLVAAVGRPVLQYSLDTRDKREAIGGARSRTGAPTLKIRQQSDAMLARYIRDGELFAGNAVGALL